MAIDQKANLKRMRELVLLIKEEIVNSPQRASAADAAINSALPSNDEAKLKSELSELIAKKPILYSDLTKVDELIAALNEPLRQLRAGNLIRYENEFGKMCHHKYDLSADYIKAANESGYYSRVGGIPQVMVKRARLDSMADLKGYADVDFHRPETWANLMLWMIREDGLYGREYWNQYNEVGVYRNLDKFNFVVGVHRNG